MGKPFKILSIDGGGFRGIIPAKYLQQVEENTNSQIHQHFDLVVGTSTGGIIALAIGAEIPMQQVVELFQTRGKAIFKKRTRFLFNTPPIVLSKYSNKNLAREVKALFGDKIIGDSSVRLCIPSINITTGKTVVYKTRHTATAVNNDESAYKFDHLLPMRDVAMATSSAPTYFPIFTLKGIGDHVDGGLWADNPSMVAIAEAVKLGVDTDDIHLLSIGTGESMFNDKCITRWLSGFLGWRTRVVDLTFLAQSQGSHFAASYLLKSENYRRITAPLPVNFKLDTTKEIERYLAYSQELYRNTVSDINAQFFTLTQQ